MQQNGGKPKPTHEEQHERLLKNDGCITLMLLALLVLIFVSVLLDLLNLWINS